MIDKYCDIKEIGLSIHRLLKISIIFYFFKSLNKTISINVSITSICLI